MRYFIMLDDEDKKKIAEYKHPVIEIKMPVMKPIEWANSKISIIDLEECKNER